MELSTENGACVFIGYAVVVVAAVSVSILPLWIPRSLRMRNEMLLDVIVELAVVVASRMGT